MDTDPFQQFLIMLCINVIGFIITFIFLSWPMLFSSVGKNVVTACVIPPLFHRYPTRRPWPGWYQMCHPYSLLWQRRWSVWGAWDWSYCVCTEKREYQNQWERSTPYRICCSGPHGRVSEKSTLPHYALVPFYCAIQTVWLVEEYWSSFKEPDWWCHS